MLFTEPTFLFLFLPVLLALYFLRPCVVAAVRTASYANWLLLVASVIFYAKGGGAFTWLMLGSIAFNYWMAIARRPRAQAQSAARARKRWSGVRGRRQPGRARRLQVRQLLRRQRQRARWLALHAPPLVVPRVLLPIGISFFTFHAISYVVDVYRGDATAQKSPVHAALYLLLFPQLIAGPIIRYRDIADQLARAHRDARRLRRRRSPLRDRPRQEGADRQRRRRAGRPDLRPAARRSSTPAHAWLGIVCYTLQIYFDFSGYSDMAIGLGRMFGFRFPENFRWPYIADTVQEFWRRWHMSLSTWFRDYLYVPLGGNRVSPARMYRQPRHRLLSVRPVARRELELRDLGPLPRHLPRRRTARPGAAR